jgi:hypothetical protein
MSTVSYVDPQPPRQQAAAPHRAGLMARLAGWALSVLETPAKALAAAAGQDGPTGRHAQGRRRTAPTCAPAPVVAPNTFSSAADIEPAAIDPARAPLELTAATTSQETAVRGLHAAYPLLPADLVSWTYLDDRACGVVHTLAGDDVLRGTVAAYAAVLGAKVRETPAAAGTVRLSTAGEHGGTRVTVEAVCGPDLDPPLHTFIAAHEDPQFGAPTPMDRIPELDEDATPLPRAAGGEGK